MTVFLLDHAYSNRLLIKGDPAQRQALLDDLLKNPENPLVRHPDMRNVNISVRNDDEGASLEWMSEYRPQDAVREISRLLPEFELRLASVRRASPGAWLFVVKNGEVERDEAASGPLWARILLDREWPAGADWVSQITVKGRVLRLTAPRQS